MSIITLTYKSNHSPSLSDGSLLRPDTLGAMDTLAIEAVMLSVGRTTVPLGELFETECTASPQNILIIRHAPQLHRLGAQMAQGTLIIEGDAGDDLGASMTGGIIHVKGNGGHRVGGPDVTSRRGMNGGEILIDGNVLDFAGFLMRRGFIAIAGTTGKSPGYRMLAGTLILGSPCVNQPGLEMLRGTIISLSSIKPPVSFAPGGTIAASAMPAMTIVLKRLRALQWPRLADAMFDWKKINDGSWQLWSGDALTINKGEVLQWQY